MRRCHSCCTSKSIIRFFFHVESIARKSVRRLVLLLVELVRCIVYKSTLNFTKIFYFHFWFEYKRLWRLFFGLAVKTYHFFLRNVVNFCESFGIFLDLQNLVCHFKKCMKHQLESELKIRKISKKGKRDDDLTN